MKQNPMNQNVRELSDDASPLFGKVSIATGVALLAGIVSTQASADYGPAIWRPTCASHQYTGYNARQVYVIHDMEGYYASTISYLQGCNNSVSVHYCVNGVQDAGSDMPAGEVTQMVIDANSAWTAGCWNRYAEQTEHEGFASNPAWFTEAMYQSSAALTASKASKYGIAKDRNHIIGHNQKTVAGWSSWAAANLSFDPNCNSHTDPGAYWDWNHYMALVGGGGVVNPPYFFNSNTQGWTAASGICCGLGWSGTGWPGVIFGDQNGTDAYIMSPATSFGGQASESVSVNVYPQFGNTSSHDMQMFFTTTAENFWDTAKSSATYHYIASNNWTRINMNVSNTKWAGQTINKLRLDFDGANHGNRWIVNDIVPQVVPRYYFGASAEGWSAGGGICCGAGWSGTGWPGVIYGDQGGADGYFVSPNINNYLGGNNDVIYVKVYPQGGNTANHDMKIYWRTASENFYTEAKSTATVNYTMQNGWIQVPFAVGANPNWINFITGIRVDVDGVNHGNRWLFDFIIIDHLQ
ncbi:MAG: nucleoside transporter [Verrucomicrobiales bacterium]|nr:nucleoside transporter [Verrucomicrobiales bacterium]